MGCRCKEKNKQVELPPLPKSEVDETTLFEINQLYVYFNSKHGDYNEANTVYKKLFGEDINLNCGGCSYNRLKAHIEKLNIPIK